MKSKLKPQIHKRGKVGRGGVKSQVGNRTMRAISKLKTTLRIDKQDTNIKSSRARRSMRRHGIMGGGNGLSTRTTFYPALVGGRAFLLLNLPEENETRSANRGGHDLPAPSEGTAAQVPAVLTPTTPRTNEISPIAEQITPNRRTSSRTYVKLDSPILSSSNNLDITTGNSNSLHSVPRPQANLGNLARLLETKKQSRSLIPADVFKEFKNSGVPATTPLKKPAGLKRNETSRGSVRVGFTSDTKGGTGSQPLKINNSTPALMGLSRGSSSSLRSVVVPNYMRPTVSSSNKVTTSTPRVSHNRKSEVAVGNAKSSLPPRRKSEFTKTPSRPLAVNGPKRPSTLFGSLSQPKLPQKKTVLLETRVIKPLRSKSIGSLKSTGTAAGRRDLVPLKATSSLRRAPIAMDRELTSKTPSTDELNVTFVVENMDVE